MKKEMVIINSGPLIALSGVECLALLPQLFQRVLVPNAVHQEVMAAPFEKSIAFPSELEIVLPAKQTDPLLLELLDQGEAEVIQLARVNKQATVLIDELKGRKVARLYDLSVIGTARLLVEAKHLKLIESVGSLFHRMKKNGYWIDDKICQWALRLSGE